MSTVLVLAAGCTHSQNGAQSTGKTASSGKGSADSAPAPSVPSEESTRMLLERLGLSEKSGIQAHRLDNKARAAVIALNRQGLSTVLDKAVTEAENQFRWRTANSYEIPVAGVTDREYSRVFHRALVESSEQYRAKIPDFVACLKPFDMYAQSDRELVAHYGRRGGAKVPQDITDEKFAQLQNKVAKASKKCGGHLSGAERDAYGFLQYAANALPEAVRVEKTNPAEGQYIPSKTRVPKCQKDNNRVVLHGGSPENPQGESLRTAALRADATMIKKIWIQKPEEFKKPNMRWVIAMLARTGCVEALNAVLATDMKVPVDYIAGEQKMTLQDELWINIGHSSTAETFDNCWAAS